ncbi:unnamed protein product [Calypogeia fissa]
MLLESALLDFSTDESEVFEDAVQHSGVGFDWETLGKSRSLTKNGGSGSNSDAAAGPAEIKHVYLERKLSRSRQSSGEFSGVRQSKALSDFLGMSRSPPAVDVNCGPSFEISRSDEDPVHGEVVRATGKEAHSGSLKTPSNGRGLKSEPDGNILNGHLSFAGDAGAVPFAWEAQPGKAKSLRGTPNNLGKQLQIPPNQAVSLFKNGKGVSPSSSQKKLYKNEKEQMQQQRAWPSSSPQARGVSPMRQNSSPQTRGASPMRQNSSPNTRGVSPVRQNSTPKATGVSPIRQSTTKVRSSSGDGRLSKKRLELFKSPEMHSRVDSNHRIRNDDADHFTNTSVNSKYKYYEEESPVSILERQPSPPNTNSSGSSGSSVHSPPRTSAPMPGGPLSRRRPPSFSSPSENVSPRASTSSSARYMGQCLVALQAALAIDPEKSKRFEDSFVEMDTFVSGEESPTYAKSPIDDDDDDDDLFNRNKKGRSPAWARNAAVSRSDLEPEYNTMDFYTDSEEEIVDQQSHISPSSSVASLARSSSAGSISRPIRRSLNYHRPMSVEDYSLKDKRFLSSHPSSWVEHGDDSIASSLTNSKCNTLTRHQEIPWDEQQADLDLVRAEEVIRGAIDGLRFTYSPVSSAFVFTRSNEGDEEGTGSGRKGGNGGHNSPQNKTFTDSEASRRFSISLDYEASMRSEGTMSFARASDVTELGMSRAESWSKVARGIAFQQGYQDAIPSSFIRRAGYTPPMFEDGNASRSSQGFNPNGALGDSTPDSRLVRKRLAKKSGMTTCLPFRAILRNFRTMGSPARSRLGVTTADGDRSNVNRLTY